MKHLFTARILTLTLAIVPAFLAFAQAARAVSPVEQINDATSKADLVVETLRGGVHVLTGAGGNIVVLENRAGKFVVDAGIAVAKDKVQAAFAQIGPGRPRYLVDTHWHWDHTDGNAWIHEAGATVVAHPNTLQHLSQVTRVDDYDYTFQPLPAEARPTVLVRGSKTMRFGGSTVVMKNFGHGHTDGDLWVHFVQADVLVLGDTFWNGVYPFIDNADGGGINGAIHWADEAIAHSTDRTIVVPGHGPVGDRGRLIDFRDMLVAVRDNVLAMKRQGKTLAEVIAARPTAAYDDKWRQFPIDPAFLTRLVYAGL